MSIWEKVMDLLLLGLLHFHITNFFFWLRLRKNPGYLTYRHLPKWPLRSFWSSSSLVKGFRQGHGRWNLLFWVGLCSDETSVPPRLVWFWVYKSAASAVVPCFLLFHFTSTKCPFKSSTARCRPLLSPQPSQWRTTVGKGFSSGSCS